MPGAAPPRRRDCARGAATGRLAAGPLDPVEPPEPPGAGDHPLDEEGLQLPHGRQLGEELFAEREPARLVLVGEEDLAGERPWVRAFWQATAFPSGVRGPVERSAFCRLAPRRGEVVIRRGAFYHGHCNRIQTGVGDSFAIVATSYSASDAKGHPPPTLPSFRPGLLFPLATQAPLSAAAPVRHSRLLLSWHTRETSESSGGCLR